MKCILFGNKSCIKMLIGACFLIGMFSCKKDKNKPDYSKNLTVQKIWSNGTYCAFTDFIKYDGRWYCVFREADNHVGGKDGVIRILTSNDAIQWKTDHILEVSGTDLRDPKLMLGYQQELVVYVGGINKSRILENLVWKITPADSLWKGPFSTTIKGDWLWRITRSSDNIMFSMAYQFITRQPPVSTISLYTSRVDDFPKFSFSHKIADNGCLSECSMLFQQNGTMLAVGRRDCDDRRSWLGIASQPYTNIKWTDLNMIMESPNIISTKDGIYVAGRVYDPNVKTALYKLNLGKKRLEKVSDLPSNLDTGYPGLWADSENLWISYYSADENSHRSIYLCKYRFN